MAKKRRKNYLVSALGSFVFVALIKFFFPDMIPFTFFGFWDTRGGVFDWIWASWPIFAWCVGVSSIVSALTSNDHKVNREAETILFGGALISAFAGITEEIAFRWLIFLSSIASAVIGNFWFFGFMGFGIPEWLYLYVAAPVADFFTFGKIAHLLYHPTGWAVGAGMLASNAFFRDGHKYLGFLGFVNSWFIGMFLFWLLFEYGLVACIVVHFLYDLFIFVVWYIDAAIERALGWT